MAIFDRSVPVINLYVDGVLSNGTSGFSDGSNVKSSPIDLSIGNNNALTQYQLFGYLDDLMIFNRPLLPAEVKLIYSMQKTLSPPVSPKKLNTF